MLGVLGHDQQELFSGCKRAGRESGTNEFVQLHIPLERYHTANERRGKEPALRLWTLRVFTHFVARVVWQDT